MWKDLFIMHSDDLNIGVSRHCAADKWPRKMRVKEMDVLKALPNIS